LVATEISQADVLRGVVVSVVLVPTLLTHKVVVVAVVWMVNPQCVQRCEVFLGSTCSTAMPCSSALYSTYSYRRLNAHLCPPRSTGSLTDVSQVLKRDDRTLVLTGFRDEFVADAMEQLEPSVFFSSD